MQLCSVPFCSYVIMYDLPSDQYFVRKENYKLNNLTTPIFYHMVIWCFAP